MESGDELVDVCKLYCGGVIMIVREYYATRKDGVRLFRTYSDAGYMIRQEQTGIEYAEAIDVENAPYTYTETETRADTEGEP